MIQLDRTNISQLVQMDETLENVIATIPMQYGSFSYITNLEAFTISELAQFNIYPVFYTGLTYDSTVSVPSTAAPTVTFSTTGVSGTGVYVIFEIDSIPTSALLATAINNKIQAIVQAFNMAPTAGCFCPSVGWQIDCERIDIENMQNLVTYFNSMQVQLSAMPSGAAQTAAISALNTQMNGIAIKDFNSNIHVVTLTQVQNILTDMIGYGIALYQRKFTAIAEAQAATTVEQANAVVF